MITWIINFKKIESNSQCNNSILNIYIEEMKSDEFVISMKSLKLATSRKNLLCGVIYSNRWYSGKNEFFG